MKPPWIKTPDLEKLAFKHLLGFILIVVVTSVILENRHNSKRYKLINRLWFIAFLLIASVLSFSTAILKNDNQLLTQWHHWSAYIGPAEQFLSGSIIFHDFPAQYGLGPTVLIASICGDNCWVGMYYIVGFVTLLFSLLICMIANFLSGNHWGERLIILVLCLAVCFFWNAYPPSVGIPTVTPSVGGLRFLPVLILVSYLFFSRNIGTSKTSLFIAHFLWLIGMLWSPESAFYVTFVWGGYYLFIFRGVGSFILRFKKLFKNTISLIFMGLIFLSIFIVPYSAIYNLTPTLYGYLAYVLNPPGEMPINYFGGIWFIFLVNLLGITSLILNWKNNGDNQSFRRGFLVQLLFYSVFTYFLGRSHDNNLLNLMPFALLVLLSVRFISDKEILIRVSNVLCATLLGWLILFGWNSWKDINILEGEVLIFNKNLLGNSASLSNSKTQVMLSERMSLNDSGLSYMDASRAISYIHSNYSEPITVLDFSMSLENSQPQIVWSAFHNPANVFFISSKNRRIFLSNTARRLQRNGWLVVNSKYPADEWLNDLNSTYDLIERLEFGSFYAIRFRPKLN